MILRLLLITGQVAAQAKFIYLVVMISGSGLASAQGRRRLYIVETNCHASTGGLHVINSSEELTFHTFGTGLTPLYKLP